MDKKILDKFGVTDEWINKNAEQYESGTFELSDATSPIFYGKPEILKANQQYIAIPYDNEEITRVNYLAEQKGVEPETIYRLAMRQYLQTA